MGFADSFQRLRILEANRVEQTPPPVELPLAAVHQLPEVFQPRRSLCRTVEETHVLDLISALENEPSGLLDPITVWWSGEGWFLVDGHHRYEAYKRFYFKGVKQGGMLIPVTVVAGGVLEALSASISENAKVRLGLNDSDRFDTAWRLVCAGERNRNKIAPRCGIGPSTVQAMMTRMRAILSEDPTVDINDLAEQGWAYARDLGRAERVIDDEWVDNLASEWARRLSKEFGAKLRKNPDVLFKALRLYSEPMTERLHQRMSDYFGRDPEEEMDY